LSASGIAGVAFVNSQVAAAVAMMTWMWLDYQFVSNKKWNGVKIAEGCVIGLATVTPAAGFIHLQSSLAFGFFGAIVVFLACQLKHRKFGATDDTLDVFCCHGVGGITGIFMLGLFASKDINPYL
jgi:Amt family ammonium transporter